MTLKLMSWIGIAAILAAVPQISNGQRPIPPQPEATQIILRAHVFELTSPLSAELLEDTKGIPEGAVFVSTMPVEAVEKALKRLREEKQAKIIASPAVATFDGRSAEVQVRGEPSAAFSLTNNTKGGEIRSIGTRLRVVPRLMPEQRLHLTLMLEDSREADGNRLSVVSRKLETTGELEAGEALFVLARFDGSDSEGSPRGGPLAMFLTRQGSRTVGFPASSLAGPVAAPRNPSLVLSNPLSPDDYRRELSQRLAHLQQAERELRAAGQSELAEQIQRAAAEVRGELDREATRATPREAHEDSPHQAIESLRGEVRELRRDVQRLIELLESRAAANEGEAAAARVVDPAAALPNLYLPPAESPPAAPPAAAPASLAPPAPRHAHRTDNFVVQAPSAVEAEEIVRLAGVARPPLQLRLPRRI